MFSDGFPVLILISSIFKGRRQLVDILKYLFLKFLLLPTLHLEKEMATHSSILAWKIPWTEEPGGLQSMVRQKCWTWLSNWTTAFRRYYDYSYLTKEKSTLPPLSLYSYPKGTDGAGAQVQIQCIWLQSPSRQPPCYTAPLLVEGSYRPRHGLFPSPAQVLQFLFINSFPSQAFGVFLSSYVQICSVHVCWMT